MPQKQQPGMVAIQNNSLAPKYHCAHLSQGNGGAAVASSESSGRSASNGQATIGEGLGKGLSDGSAACLGGQGNANGR